MRIRSPGEIARHAQRRCCRSRARSRDLPQVGGHLRGAAEAQRRIERERAHRDVREARERRARMEVRRSELALALCARARARARSRRRAFVPRALPTASRRRRRGRSADRRCRPRRALRAPHSRPPRSRAASRTGRGRSTFTMRATPSLPTTTFAGQSSPWIAPSGTFIPSRRPCSALQPCEDVEQDAHEHRHRQERIARARAVGRGGAHEIAERRAVDELATRSCSSPRGVRGRHASRDRCWGASSSRGSGHLGATARAPRRRAASRLRTSRAARLADAHEALRHDELAAARRMAANERCERFPSSRSIRYVTPRTPCAPFDIGPSAAGPTRCRRNGEPTDSRTSPRDRMSERIAERRVRLMTQRAPATLASRLAT